MSLSFEGTTTKDKGKMGNRLWFYLFTFALCLPAAGGCRQKMSEQPYHRPLEGSDFYPIDRDHAPDELTPPAQDGRASRPLERGVVHRGQSLDVDPLVTGLTREEWARAYASQAAPKVDATLAPKEDRTKAFGAPRFDPPGFKPTTGEAHPGPQIYVSEFPFTITDADIARGEERYSIYCAVCHGKLGNGEGKLWERRYLKPTSFHTTPVAEGESVELRDGVWYEKPHDLTGSTGFAPAGLPLGYSRGYGIPWRINIGMPDVPVGYYFEVITKGYGGMPSYSAQIPPADRWRIIAYIRVLQQSQRTPAADLPEAIRKKVEAGGKQ